MKLTDLLTMKRIIPGLLPLCLALVAQAQSTDAHFASGKRARAIPFELEANVIFLRVGVNGAPPLSFILDTGAYSIINTRQAKALGLGIQLVGKTDSIGAAQQDVYLVTDRVSFSLPGVTLSGPRLLAISLDKVQDCIDRATAEPSDPNASSGQSVKAGTKIVLDGILGKEFFSSFVVEIDYAARLLNVYDPASYKYTGRGESFPLELAPQHIFVRAQVKPPGRAPIAARLLVDTGAATALRLTKRFTEAHKLLPSADKLTAVPECGLGGYAKEQAWEGTLEALQLGSFKLPNPVTVFSQEAEAQDYDGFLGGLALRNFRVIFDYSRRWMILERIARNR
jgi:hypothetical protein